MLLFRWLAVGLVIVGQLCSVSVTSPTGDVRYNSNSTLLMAASLNVAHRPSNQPALLCWDLSAHRFAQCKVYDGTPCRDKIHYSS